jgi:hypothetical protein
VIPLDRIDVPALDLEGLILLDPALRSVLAPIMVLENFSALFLPEKPISRYAPMTVIAHKDWARDLIA